MVVKKVSLSDFKELIQDDSTLLVVDAYADWCGPCKFSSPQFEKLSQAYESKATFIKFNVDEESQLGQAFNIRSIPAFFILKGNKILASTVGANVKKVELDLKKIIKEEIQSIEMAPATGYN